MMNACMLGDFFFWFQTLIYRNSLIFLKQRNIMLTLNLLKNTNTNNEVIYVSKMYCDQISKDGIQFRY